MMEGRWGSVALVSIMTMSILSGYVMSYGSEWRPYTPRDPILIQGDAEFTTENGVTHGTGTSEDPFIIEGHGIGMTGGIGIEISGTSSHFVVRDCLVDGALAAVYLHSVSNGRVEFCEISDSDIGISVSGGADIVVANNQVSGEIGVGSYNSDCIVESNMCTSISVGRCAGVIVRNNYVLGDVGYSVRIYSSTGVIVQSNTVGGSGCHLSESVGCSLWRNSFVHSGVVLGGSEASDFYSHDIPTNNTANSRPIFYLKNISGATFSEPEVGQVIVVNCHDMILEDFTIEDISCTWDTPWDPDWYSGGLEFYFASNVTVSGGTIQNCGNAIVVYRVFDLRIQSCDIVDSSTGVFVTESEYVAMSQCSITCSDEVDGAGLTVQESNFTSVLNSTFTNCASGVGVVSALSTVIENCTMTISGQNGVRVGAYLEITSGLTVRNCTITGASRAGVEARDTDDILVENCTISDCERAMDIMSATNTSLIDNSVFANWETGLFLYGDVNVMVSGNELLGNGVNGLYLWSCLNTTVTRNTIRGNNYGAACVDSADTLVFHNDFAGNIISAYPQGGTGNAWDDGYTGGGNFWSDYEGMDQYSGPGQDVLGGDGIGDDPYQTPSGLEFDYYPLMVPVIGPPNEIPGAFFTTSPGQGNITTNFSLDASGSFDAEDPSSELLVRWDIGSDDTWEIGWSTEKVAHWTFSTTGFSVVRMQVRDTGWLLNYTVSSVYIVDEAPVAAFLVTPEPGIAEMVLSFNASVSLDLENGSVSLEVRWDWESDGIWDEDWTYNKISSHAFLVPATYNVKLEVRDRTGLTNSTTKQVVVAPDEVAPLADAGSDQRIDVEERVWFDGWGSSDNVRIVNYTWSVPINGLVEERYGVVANMTFAVEGEYNVTLVVRDSAGLEDSDTVLITVGGEGGSVLADLWWVGVLAAVVIVAFVAVLLLRGRGKAPA